MASVQELLAASQANSNSPFADILSGVGQGFMRGYQAAPARALELAKVQEMQEAARRQATMEQEVKQQLAAQTEAQTRQGLNNVSGGAKPAAPALKFKQVISQDEKGNYSRKFEQDTTAPTAPKYGELTQAQQDAVDKALAEGRLAPAQITRGPKLATLASQFIKDPTYSAIASDVKFGGAKAQSAATGQTKGGAGFKMEAISNSLEDTLRQMEPLVSELSPTSLRVLNDAWQRGLAQTNDADANAVLALGNTARGLYSQVVAGGAGTVESDKKANETIGRGLNAEGFKGMKYGVLSEGYTRSGHLSGKLANPLNKPSGYIDPGGSGNGNVEARRAALRAKLSLGGTK